MSVHHAAGDQHGRRPDQHVEDRGPGHRPRSRVQHRWCAHRVFQHDRIAHGRGFPVDYQRPRVRRESAATQETHESSYFIFNRNAA